MSKKTSGRLTSGVDCEIFPGGERRVKYVWPKGVSRFESKYVIMEKLGPGMPLLFYFQAAGPNGGCSWPLKRLEEVLGDYALSFTTEFNYSHPGCSVRIVWREAVAAFRKEGYMLCCREGSISKSESVGYEGFNGNEVRVGRLLLSRWSESFPSRLR